MGAGRCEGGCVMRRAAGLRGIAVAGKAIKLLWMRELLLLGFKDV